METDLIIGIIVLIVSVLALVGLVVWANRIINRLWSRDFGSGRQALKELNG